MKALAPSLAAGALSAACMGSPTPLAPQLAGSIGVPHQGVQTGAAELARQGEGFIRFRWWGSAYWGNPRLIATIEEAAARLEREAPGGAPLVVGDLSAQHGGKIPRHASHRTGRDVDFLWFVKDVQGNPVKNPGFIHFQADGLATVGGTGDYLQLDVERQWLFFRSLLRSPHANVQWLFVSEEIEALLVDYARAKGEPLELIWQAETVMLQPGDSLPHDDHVHLRIACTPSEAARGCLGGGPYWEWLPPLPQLGPLGPDVLQSIARDDPMPDEPAAAVATDPPASGTSSG